MDCSGFIKSTIMNLQPEWLEQVKKTLVEDYISFSIIAEENITQEILAEKLCDYIEKLELKSGKDFDKHIEVYMKNLDSIVESRIAKTPKPKKNDTTPVVIPRSRKYYEKALSLKKVTNFNTRTLIDYTRIMFCLYSAIIKNGFKEIDNLDYSSDCLNPKNIIEAMKNEQESIVVSVVKKPKFDIKELYSSDTCTFILATILVYKILNDTVLEDADHE